MKTAVQVMKMMCRITSTVHRLAVLLLLMQSAAADERFFETSIRPLLTERCLGCHSAATGKTQGGLALDTKSGWQKGGDSGPTIVPGDVDRSLLIRAVLYHDDGPQMPPADAGGKLRDAEIALLTQWVQQGAFDPRTEMARRGGLTESQIRNWWSFQPPKAIAVPEISGGGNEIDRFILQKLAAAGLKPAPEADRRTLIRRVTYDLTGLPPTADEVDAFLADQSSTAWETLVERLLQSPRYGEHWGRHWLDVVRYADTAGENTDHPIPDAWRYRNWVISAFNNDLPYDQFVRDQIAGDLIHAGGSAEEYAAGVTGTGFLAIARRFDHDSDKFMHLTFEDAIDTMGQAFLGLSVACARCHDHKFDPITAHDYYALYGILNSTRFAFPGCEAKQQPRDLIPLLPPDAWEKVVQPFDQQMSALDAELKLLQDSQMSAVAAFRDTAAAATELLAEGIVADGGDATLSDAAGDPLSPITISSGQMLQLIIDPDNNYGADTTQIEWQITEVAGQQRSWQLTDDVITDFLAANPHSDRYGNPATWLFLDARGGPSLLTDSVRDSSGTTGLLIWRTGDNPSVFVNATEQSLNLWTPLPPKSLFVHPAQDGPVAVAWISPFDGQVQIRGRVIDAHPGGPNGVRWRLERHTSNLSIAVQQLAGFSKQRQPLLTQREQLLARAPAREMAYGVTEGNPGNVRMHLRGDPEKPGDEIQRRWLEILGGHIVPEGAGSGRRQLAEWLTDPANPLVARVIVNRIWQKHFGKGLVSTPNDFGTRGHQPTHPELLDWLALRFQETGWSVKAMHRLILHSATWRQASLATGQTDSERSGELDPANQLYWRFDRRRLSAEELRDSLLLASGELDTTPGGPHPIPPSSTWSFSQHVPFSGVPETNKRSVYLLTLRNRRHPFLGLFDGADPNATTPVRQVTTVPTQSLYFMNDEFFHGRSVVLAQKLLQNPDEVSRLTDLFRTLLQRSPTPSERQTIKRFLDEYQIAVQDLPAAEQTAAVWAAAARLLMSSNEFLYPD
ncbi:MAG: hypothetical protein RLZZ232_2556 [Planctomycetota bacterium]